MLTEQELERCVRCHKVRYLDQGEHKQLNGEYLCSGCYRLEHGPRYARQDELMDFLADPQKYVNALALQESMLNMIEKDAG